MIRWLLVLFFSLIGPVVASAADIPGLYHVVDVASDDSLNVRAGPGASYDAIGTLTFDATGIEVVALSDDGTWGQVNLGEQAGWTSMRFLQAEPEHAYALSPVLSCFGTEPFWQLDIRQGQSMTLSTPETSVGMTAGLIQTAWGRPDRFWLRGSSSADTVAVTIRKAACNDGMSDRQFGLDADLLIDSPGNSYLLSGCCSLQP